MIILSLKETLKKLLNIKKNNVFYFSKKSEKCQTTLNNQGINKLCWKSLKLIQYKKYPGYFLLHLKCLNDHDVVRKLINSNFKIKLINIKN